MRPLKIILLVLLAFLFLGAALITSKVIVANQEGGLYFFSLKPGFSWQNNQDQLDLYVKELTRIAGKRPKVLILVFPGTTQSFISTGWEDNPPVYRGVWGVLNDWKIFKVYVDSNEWTKRTQQEENVLLGRFTIKEINSKFYLDFTQNNPLLNLVRYF